MVFWEHFKVASQLTSSKSVIISHNKQKQSFFGQINCFRLLYYKHSLCMSLHTLTRPVLSDSQMTQVISDAFVFRKIRKVGLLDLEPVLGSAFCCMPVLLFLGHVRPADPVLVLSFALQLLQCVAFHLPSNLSRPSILSDPLLSRNTFSQKGEGEEHDGKVFL